MVEWQLNNAELWGRPTDAPWGVIFSGLQRKIVRRLWACAPGILPVIRSTFRGYIFLLIFIVALRGLKKPGLFLDLFAGYGLSRFIVEFFRVADAQFISFENPQGYVYQFGSIGAGDGPSFIFANDSDRLCFCFV